MNRQNQRGRIVRHIDRLLQQTYVPPGTNLELINTSQLVLVAWRDVLCSCGDLVETQCPVQLGGADQYPRRLQFRCPCGTPIEPQYAMLAPTLATTKAQLRAFATTWTPPDRDELEQWVAGHRARRTAHRITRVCTITASVVVTVVTLWAMLRGYGLNWVLPSVFGSLVLGGLTYVIAEYAASLLTTPLQTYAIKQGLAPVIGQYGDPVTAEYRAVERYNERQRSLAMANAQRDVFKAPVEIVLGPRSAASKPQASVAHERSVRAQS